MADKMEISGKVTAHLKAESGMGNKGAWQKQSFIIETTDQYPKQIMLTCWNDMVNNIPQVGSDCTAAINIESKEFNERWFTNITAWSIKIAGGGKKQSNNDFNPNPSGKPSDDLPW